MSAGSSRHNRQSRRDGLGRRRNPHRLYRNKDRAVLGGVCAGLAEYFGFSTGAVRIATLIALIPFTTIVIVGYVILALVLPVRPPDLYESPEQESFWRDVTNRPRDTFGELRHRFRELDHRLQRMEAYVTSKRYEIDRELRD